MPAVEAWFLGGPADGRLAPIEVGEAGELPQVVLLLQTGFYIGAEDQPRPPVEHRYVRDPVEDSPPVYRYDGADDDG
ncbi:hypothetical protein GKC29_25335 [Micromonospora sp. WMMC415]|uniref:hypothetical protein n=1 Tax=Micromonospora sp. WMMC415 TaxID=2675222 RepID=UPI0012B4AAF5|nr:hypothetical protein [Micromonospora sp. WMMC415]QGN49819.1 hypothetical protein GKC29_25335 [Micromonospora sp. WMMC415]